MSPPQPGSPPRGVDPSPPPSTTASSSAAGDPEPAPLNLTTVVGITAFTVLLTVLAGLVVVGASTGIVKEWSLLRLMTVVIAVVGVLLLGSAVWLAGLKIAAAAKTRIRRPMEQSLGEEAAPAFAEAIATVFSSTDSAGRLALGGSVHLWVAGVLAAVDVIYKG